MMRKMGYNLQHGKGLNFRKGRRAFLRNSVPRGKPVNYYDSLLHQKEIHLDPDKVKAIQNMHLSKNLKELRGLQGKLAYIRRFFANLLGRCQPFT